MAVACILGSTQYVQNIDAPITTFPVTVGFWFNLIALPITQRYMWSLADTGTSNNYFSLGFDSTPALQIGAAAGGISATSSVATASVADRWSYVVGRFISATNRRISALHPSGLVEHAQNTSSRSPSGIDAVALGIRTGSSPTLPVSARIAEYWIFNGDIQADGAQLADAWVRQLAYGGPFSMAHVAAGLVDYRAFRQVPPAERFNDVYEGPFGRQNWSPVNSPTTTFHVPLPPRYVTPGQRKRVLAI